MTDIKVQCVWTVRERIDGEWKTAIEMKNTFTTFGLSALASAISGNYSAPNFLVLESNYTTLTLPQNIGDTQVTFAQRVDQASDTAIVVSLGLPNQEVCTFISVAQAIDGVSWTYQLASPLAYNHSQGDYATRQVYLTDTMSSVLNEVQYDTVNASTLRLQSVAGYSPGTGQWAIQFYYPSNTALSYISHVGLSDTQVVANGNLHNHCLIGYDHTGQTSDIEIDGLLTLINA